MQFAGQGKPPLGIIFDSDMGARIDAALALALLYGFEGKGEARLTSVSVSKSNLKAAAYCEAVGRFYAGATSPEVRFFFRSLPVGLSTDGKMPEDTPMLTVPLSKRNAEGAPVYNHGIGKLNDSAEVTALIRNAFTAQQDQNSVVILAGPAINLVKVLDLPGAKDLILRKVRLLSVAAGAYPEGQPEFHIQGDIAAAESALARLGALDRFDARFWESLQASIRLYYLLDFEENWPGQFSRQPGEADTIQWSGDRVVDLPEQPSDIPDAHRYTPSAVADASPTDAGPGTARPESTEPRRYVDPR